MPLPNAMETPTASSRAGYADTAGLRLLRELGDAGRFLFTTDEARSAALPLGISEAYLRPLLARLVDGGWLVRLRRGLYAGTGGRLGQMHLHPFVIATHLVPDAVVSHWSAMQHHGLTEQLPSSVQATTTHKVNTPSMRNGRRDFPCAPHAWEVGGARYEYVTVRPEHLFGVEQVWIDREFRVPMTDRERTLLEGFVSPGRFGGMGEVLGILEESVADLDLPQLVGYALRYGKASVAKRLGWSLSEVGVAAELLTPLERLPVSGFRALDPTRRDQGPCDKRWMIQNNLTAPLKE